ncbi:hypothetical protein LTR62_007766 [Meristemomyces frigidus]|uniref:Secreted protein n=1 Tax=Meristemomyces frigidus TaxID=1508187 RepID=A0AAN7TAH6_9PEZI|nr:hypothetical protein LTR62_007766 [Meristemomyces frigidus]
MNRVPLVPSLELVLALVETATVAMLAGAEDEAATTAGVEEAEAIADDEKADGIM